MAGDETIKNYQLNAEKCLELAQTFKDLESKRVLVSMGNAWLKVGRTTRQEDSNRIGHADTARETVGRSQIELDRPRRWERRAGMAWFFDAVAECSQ
jgi:hypothetical protein